LGYADGPLESVEPAEIAGPSRKATEELTEHEIAQATDLLARLKPGFLPFDIFHGIARLVAMPIVEIVPLRRSLAGKVEILLLERESDDPIWPGQLHVPGTVVRASDTPGSFTTSLKRVLSKELLNAKTSEPIFVKSILHHSGRGMEVSQIFWVDIEGEVSVGEFHDAENLPDSVVKSQLDFIPDAVAHFKNFVP